MIALNDFPKGKKLLQEFAKRNLLAFQKNVMKEQPIEGLEIPEITEEMAENYANALISSQPRLILDFMDENEIFICTSFFQGEFFGNIPGSLYESKAHKERIELEQEMYNEAFKQLEEKL